MSANQTFDCPTCGEKFPLAGYLDHAKHCGEPKNAGNSSNADSVTSSREETPARIAAPVPPPVNQPPGMNCPICNQHFSMREFAVHVPTCHARQPANEVSGGAEKRPIIDGSEPETGKRSRLADGPDRLEYGQQIDGDGTSGMVPMQMDRRHGASLADLTQQQQPLSMNLSQSRLANVAAINNSPDVSVEIIALPGVQRREPQPRPQEPPLFTSSRVSTPQQSQLVGAPPMAANVYQPQYANAGPQDQVALQAPVLPNQIAQPRRLKEEAIEHHVGGAAAVAHGPNLNNQEVVNAVYQRLAPRLRQMENQIGDVRRRLELFEASLMLRLGAIEAAINRFINRDDDLG